MQKRIIDIISSCAFALQIENFDNHLESLDIFSAGLLHEGVNLKMMMARPFIY